MAVLWDGNMTTQNKIRDGSVKVTLNSRKHDLIQSILLFRLILKKI